MGEIGIKRIALLFEFAALNGGERSMLAVLDWLVRHRTGDGVVNFEFVAIAPTSGPLFAALTGRGIAVHPLPLRDQNGRRLPIETVLSELNALIRKLRVDLVHANSLSMGRLTGGLADDLPVPAIAHIRDILKLSRAAVGKLNRNRRIVAVSDATRLFHVAQGLDPNRIDVIHNGIDCDEFQPREAGGWRERELGVKPAEILIASIGQIGLRKGLDVLAEAAALNAARLPQVHYMLIGSRHSAKLESVQFEKDVMQRFVDAGLAGRFHRLGERNDVARLLNEADLLVHAAHQEPLGRVLLEAAASGVAVVATAVGGTTEIFTDGVSARLVPPADARALADAVAELVGNEEKRNRLAQAARSCVRQRFTIAEAARRLADIWSDVLSRQID